MTAGIARLPYILTMTAEAVCQLLEYYFVAHFASCQQRSQYFNMPKTMVELMCDLVSRNLLHHNLRSAPNNAFSQTCFKCGPTNGFNNACSRVEA